MNAFASNENKNAHATTSIDASENGYETNSRIPTIICGDMNSKPGSIVHKLFVEPHVDARTVAPWRYFWDQDSEKNYTEDENGNVTDDVSRGGGDRRDGQDPVVAGTSGLAEGGDSSGKEVQNGFMMSGLPTDFAMNCGIIDSNNEQNDDKDKNVKIKSEITEVSNPGKESPEKVNPQSDASFSTSLLSEAIDGISSSYDELKATLASRRLNEHKTPQDYQHSTPPSPVKYVLDYTLNRFTRLVKHL